MSERESDLPPEPVVTGKTGNQTETAPELVVMPPQLGEQLLSRVIAQHEGGIRSSAVPFVQHGIRQSERLLDDALARTDFFEKQLAEVTDKYHAEKESGAVLRERLAGGYRAGFISSITLTIGGVILGAAVQQHMTGRSVISDLGEIVGLLLIFVSWVGDLVGWSKRSRS